MPVPVPVFVGGAGAVQERLARRSRRQGPARPVGLLRAARGSSPCVAWADGERGTRLWRRTASRGWLRLEPGHDEDCGLCISSCHATRATERSACPRGSTPRGPREATRCGAASNLISCAVGPRGLCAAGVSVDRRGSLSALAACVPLEYPSIGAGACRPSRLVCRWSIRR